MPPKLDPYKILGVERSATPAEIKSAYRKKAMKAHPDHGGSADEFARVNRANIVLSDPAKREKFDRSGEIDDDSPQNTISASMSIIVGFFQAAVQEFVDGRGGDPCEADMVPLAKQHFSRTISNLESQKRKLAKMAAKLRKVADKLKKKSKGENMVLRPLRFQADQCDAQINLVEQQIKAHKDAIDMLGDLSFEFDAKPNSMYGSPTDFTWFTRGS